MDICVVVKLPKGKEVRRGTQEYCEWYVKAQLAAYDCRDPKLRGKRPKLEVRSAERPPKGPLILAGVAGPATIDCSRDSRKKRKDGKKSKRGKRRHGRKR